MASSAPSSAASSDASSVPVTAVAAAGVTTGSASAAPVSPPATASPSASSAASSSIPRTVAVAGGLEGSSVIASGTSGRFTTGGIPESVKERASSMGGHHRGKKMRATDPMLQQKQQDGGNAGAGHGGRGRSVGLFSAVTPLFVGQLLRQQSKGKGGSKEESKHIGSPSHQQQQQQHHHHHHNHQHQEQQHPHQAQEQQVEEKGMVAGMEHASEEASGADTGAIGGQEDAMPEGATAGEAVNFADRSPSAPSASVEEGVQEASVMRHAAYAHAAIALFSPLQSPSIEFTDSPTSFTSLGSAPCTCYRDHTHSVCSEDCYSYRSSGAGDSGSVTRSVGSGVTTVNEPWVRPTVTRVPGMPEGNWWEASEEEERDTAAHAVAAQLAKEAIVVRKSVLGMGRGSFLRRVTEEGDFGGALEGGEEGEGEKGDVGQQREGESDKEAGKEEGGVSEAQFADPSVDAWQVLRGSAAGMTPDILLFASGSQPHQEAQGGEFGTEGGGVEGNAGPGASAVGSGEPAQQSGGIPAALSGLNGEAGEASDHDGSSMFTRNIVLQANGVGESARKGRMKWATAATGAGGSGFMQRNDYDKVAGDGNAVEGNSQEKGTQGGRMKWVKEAEGKWVKTFVMEEKRKNQISLHSTGRTTSTTSIVSVISTATTVGEVEREAGKARGRPVAAAAAAAAASRGQGPPPIGQHRRSLKSGTTSGPVQPAHNTEYQPSDGRDGGGFPSGRGLMKEEGKGRGLGGQMGRGKSGVEGAGGAEGRGKTAFYSNSLPLTRGDSLKRSSEGEGSGGKLTGSFHANAAGSSGALASYTPGASIGGNHLLGAATAARGSGGGRGERHSAHAATAVVAGGAGHGRISGHISIGSEMERGRSSSLRGGEDRYYKCSACDRKEGGHHSHHHGERRSSGASSVRRVGGGYEGGISGGLARQSVGRKSGGDTAGARRGSDGSYRVSAPSKEAGGLTGEARGKDGGGKSAAFSRGRLKETACSVPAAAAPEASAAGAAGAAAEPALPAAGEPAQVVNRSGGLMLASSSADRHAHSSERVKKRAVDAKGKGKLPAEEKAGGHDGHAEASSSRYSGLSKGPGAEHSEASSPAASSSYTVAQKIASWQRAANAPSTSSTPAVAACTGAADSLASDAPGLSVLPEAHPANSSSVQCRKDAASNACAGAIPATSTGKQQLAADAEAKTEKRRKGARSVDSGKPGMEVSGHAEDGATAAMDGGAGVSGNQQGVGSAACSDRTQQLAVGENVAESASASAERNVAHMR